MSMSKAFEVIERNRAGKADAETGIMKTSAIAGGAWEGASQVSAELAMWQPSLKSADGENLPSAKIIKARSRDSSKNDPLISGAVRSEKDTVVGDQFRLNHQPVFKALPKEFDEAWAEEAQEEIEAKWDLYVNSPMAWADAEGNKSWVEMVRLAVGINFVDGNCLSVLEWIEDRGRPYSTAIKFVSTDRLSNPRDADDTSRLRGGIESNIHGAAIAYHIRNAHPAETFMGSMEDIYTWRRVERYKPWGRPMVLHIFEQNSAEQTLGVSMMASALKETKMSRNFQDVCFQSAVAAASFAGVITSDLDPAKVMEILGKETVNAGPSAGGNGVNELLEGVNSYYANYLDMVSAYTGGRGNNIARINGAKIPHLPPNSKLDIQHLGKDSTLGSNLEHAIQRRMAASIGQTFEEFTRNFSEANYSSLRYGLVLTQRAAASRRKSVAEKFANTVFRAWLEEAIMTGQISSMPRTARRLGWIYEGQNLDALAHASWIAGSNGQIDEFKETQAASLRVKEGLSSRSEEAARLGKNVEEVDRQRAKDLRRQKDLEAEYGVEFDEKRTKSQAALVKTPQ